MGPFPFDFERQAIGRPGKVSAERIEMRILQGAAVGEAHFEAGDWEEKSYATAGSALGFKLINVAECGKESSVVDGITAVGNQRSSNHKAVVVTDTGANGIEDRSVLQFVDPDSA